GLTDVPGRGGGRLSRALVLRIARVGGTAVWTGPLADEPTLDLGALPAGASRSYRLTVTLPDTGRPPGPLAGDNALMGSSVTVDWLWGVEAGAAATPTPTPGPGATPTPGPSVTPA